MRIFPVDISVPRAEPYGILRESALCLIPLPMTYTFDRTDRARLRERFFGATHTVLARL